MNEKLIALAKQSEYDANMGDHVDISLMMEKFAELIIQEAIAAIMNDSDRHRKEYFAGLVRKHFTDESRICKNCLEISDNKQCANCLYINTGFEQ
jgi:hypothetical protein